MCDYLPLMKSCATAMSLAWSTSIILSMLNALSFIPASMSARWKLRMREMPFSMHWLSTGNALSLFRPKHIWPPRKACRKMP